ICNDPVRRPNGNVHRAAPVDSEAGRVGRDEVEHLIAECGAVDLRRSSPSATVYRERMSPGQHPEMLHASELPRNFSIDTGKMPDPCIGRPFARTPANPRLKIQLPIDRLVPWFDQPPYTLADREVCRGDAPDKPLTLFINSDGAPAW